MSITWGKTVSVWWSAAWRGGIYGFIGGFVLGFIGGVTAAVLHTPEKAPIYGMVGGYIAAIPASMLGLKQALSKHLASLAAIANGTSS
ncbi:hypothetical protein ACXU4B_10635 [Dyella soli]|uniref:Uncharacterized protein n=1 Tax=Dyella soli TaxID=522319 RepID=A0A4R0YGJ9_9GAMM|nr:hypothetical protein [Dyella soli]TCI07364.1 hypothetical protein EZM97_32790 [Dyella soli]